MKVYSLDEERFYELDDIIDIVDSEYEEHEKSELIIYEGVKSEYTHEDFLRVDWLIKNMKDLAWEESEYSDSYLSNFSYHKEKELEQVILNWFNDNIEQPNFFQVLKSTPVKYIDVVK